MNSFAILALAEFTRRKASIDEAVRANRYPRTEGERVLGCWMSVALSAGVPPAELGALIEHWQHERDLTNSWARHILLWEGPPEAEWHAELSRARDQAATKARGNPNDRQLQDRSQTLQCLAIYLGLAPEAPLAMAA